ncbi:MAG: pantoate--beta-alanine ligase [Spartobacteria bacterium]|nr:pantoate--beta-alanine ligase [Spartobacteria bacterium]
MDIIRTPADMQRAARDLRRAGKTIGFVPTMGFLHEGHLSLVRIARERADVVVVSIFVNPTQFGPNEDLDAYPRDFARDEALCRGEGVDLLFYPDAADMYPANASVYVGEDRLSKVLCGASRPGHFRGVLTVVAKLFNLALPDVAVFGQKDAQQLRVIQQMVDDLNFPVEIIAGPIVREADGLAMSSRNTYLTASDRRDALCLRRALDLAEQLYADGERKTHVIRQAMDESIRQAPTAQVDYIELMDWRTLMPVETIEGPTLVALAVKVGKPRLIDNTIIAYK